VQPQDDPPDDGVDDSDSNKSDGGNATNSKVFQSLRADGEERLASGGKAIDPVLALILEEAGLDHGVELTQNVMRSILKAFGEDHWPDEVVRQMVIQACEGRISTAEVPVLDGKTLLRALTADIKAYDIEVEEAPRTIFEDVNVKSDVGTAKKRRGTSRRSLLEPLGRQEKEAETDNPPSLNRMYTADSLDYTADTYVSFNWTILVWFAIVTTFFRLVSSPQW